MQSRCCTVQAYWNMSSAMCDWNSYLYPVTGLDSQPLGYGRVKPISKKWFLLQPLPSNESLGLWQRDWVSPTHLVLNRGYPIGYPMHHISVIGFNSAELYCWTPQLQVHPPCGCVLYYWSIAHKHQQELLPNNNARLTVFSCPYLTGEEIQPDP